MFAGAKGVLDVFRVKKSCMIPATVVEGLSKPDHLLIKQFIVMS